MQMSVSSVVDKKFSKVPCYEIRLGARFSAPVFFDDGKNMFLAERKTAKQYHIDALKYWKIPYLLSYGHIIEDSGIKPEENRSDISEVEELEELEQLD